MLVVVVVLVVFVCPAHLLAHVVGEDGGLMYECRYVCIFVCRYDCM